MDRRKKYEESEKGRQKRREWRQANADQVRQEVADRVARYRARMRALGVVVRRKYPKYTADGDDAPDATRRNDGQEG